MAVGGGAIMLTVASPLLLSEFNVTTPSPRLVLSVAIILMLLPVVINIVSIQVAARVNNVAVFTEIVGTVVFGVLLFVLWGVRAKPTPYGAGILTSTTSTLHNPTWYAFALAGLLGAFTLVGFEFAADMSEDAVNPRRSVPRGVLWAVGGSAVLGMIALALLVFGVIDVGVMIYGYFQTSAFGTLVGATAIIPYIIYFLITLAYAIKRRTTDSIPGAFTLGRWAWPVIGFVLAYTVLIMVVLSFPAPFHGSDKVLGYGLALAALWYFGGLVWRLRKGTAGVKPVEDLVDAPHPAR
jgi:amino acid transporter